ncbi:MarR family winged helix-turn-helix transcriptional regulator [Lichenicoccus sp.]|uniref:MarR family winged helix-turn-helix transcriptional regulator n=1 Tax=Lichenicoccus sp. TaxID=2781899 RepID=UPI003D0A7606
MIRTEADKRARLHGMTRAQWMILSRVKRAPGLTQRALAEILEVEPISVGRLVDRLESRGLVERRSDPSDRRIWRLHLRPEATPVLAAMDVQREAIGKLLTENIADSELQNVSEVLLRMKTNIGVCRRPLAGELQASA